MRERDFQSRHDTMGNTNTSTNKIAGPTELQSSTAWPALNCSS